MSDVIRDVMIRVSIQNGQLALGPLDLSAFETSVKAAKESLEKMLGRVTIDSNLTLGSAPQGDNAGLTTAMGGMQSSVSTLTSTIASAMANFNSSLNVLMSQLRPTTTTNAAMNNNPANPRSRSNGAQSRDRAHNERIRDAKRGIREWSGIKRKKQRAEAQRFAAFSRAGRGAMLLGGLGGGSRQMATATVAAHGVHDVMSGVAGATGGTISGGLMTTLSTGAGALAYELTALTERLEETRDAAQRYRTDLADDASRAASHTMRLSDVRSHAALDFARNAPNTVGLSHIMENIAGQERMENGLRDYENSDVNPRFKAQRRQFEEFALPKEQFLQEAPGQIEDKQKRIEVLRVDLQRIQAAKIERDGQYRNETVSNRDVIDHSMDETYMGFGMRQLGKPLAWMGLTGAYNLNTGMYNSQHQAQSAAIQRQAKAKKAYAADQETFGKDEQVKTSEVNRLEKEVLGIKQQQLSTTRELQQAAYQALQSEKERVKATNVAFGSASIPQQNIAMRLQKKAERIEAQREANRQAGRDENQGIEKFTPWEMQQNAMGGIAQRTMNRQADEKAKEKGFKVESNLDDLTEQHEKQQKLPVNKIKEDISSSVDDVAKSSEQLVNKMNEVNGVIRESLEGATRAFEEMKAIFEGFKFKTNGR